MQRRKRSSVVDSKGGKGKRKQKEVEVVGEEDAAESEDWCFVCKDGGTLRLCDFPKCGKSYHFGCVGQRKSFLRSPVDWECDRHSCLHCGSSTKFTCYSCPNGICYKCRHIGEFILIAGENGFCKKCMDFALHVEGQEEQKLNLEISSIKYNYFKEYYWIIKKKYGFTLDDLRAAKNKWKIKEEREVDVNKSPGVAAQNEKVVSKLIAVAAPVHQNVRRIYLTRSVIEKLLKQPESFEARVKRTFVGLEIPQKAFSNKRVCRLVQVTGITKTSCDDGPMTVKLQGKNMPNDISIDMVSDIDFNENACKDLRQQVEDGLFEMPTIGEFQRMARDLSEDIVDDFIAREMRRLQLKMDQCNEKGWRQDFFLSSYQKKRLETPSERLRLIKMFSEVTDDRTTDEIMNEKQEINGSQESVSRVVTLCKNVKIAPDLQRDMSDPRPILKDMTDDKKQNEGCTKSAACILDLTKDESSVGNNRKRLRTSEEVFPDNRNAEMTTIEQPTELVPLNSSKAQKSSHQVCISNSHGINEPVKFSDATRKLVKVAGIPDDQVWGEHRTNEERIGVVDFTAQKFGVETQILDPSGKVLEEHQRFDVMHEELESNAIESNKKILILEHKLDMLETNMDDGLKLKGMTLEDTGISAGKIESLEEKIDRIEQNIKQMEEEKAQSAEGAIVLSNSSMFMDTLYNFLEPVTSLACTKMLEEVKAKYLPDLDLREFPNYDPNAMERVHPLFKGTIQSFIDTALAQQRTIEGKGNQLTLALQPLPSQAGEEAASQAQEELNPNKKSEQKSLTMDGASQ